MIGRRLVTASVVLAAVAAGGVAGAVIGIPGISGASSSPTAATSTTVPNGGRHLRGFPGPSLGAGKDVLGAAAQDLKLSTTDLLQKLSDGKTTIADVAKEQNVDLQKVIDDMTAVAKEDISKLVNNPFPVGRSFGAKGPGRGGVPGLGIRGALGSSLDAVAKALGISTADLRSDLGKGQSIADIAKSKSIDVKTVIATLVNDAKSALAAAVKAGHLTQDQADKLGSNLEQMITNAVNSSHSMMGGPHGGFGGRFGARSGKGGPGYGMGSDGNPSPASPMPSL